MEKNIISLASKDDLKKTVNSGSKRLQSIQVLRGIAALMVAISHLGIIETKYGYSGQHLLSNANIGQAGVDLFFLISGFIMVVTMYKHFGTSKNIPNFLLRRSIRIYPIYWVYAIVIVIAMTIRPEWVNSSFPGETRYLTSFLLLPSPGVPIMMVAWTLEYEMFFYFIFALLMFLPFRRLLPILTVFFGVLVLLGEFVYTEGNWARWGLNPILLEFLMGVALGHLYLKKRWGNGWLLTFAGISLWALMAFFSPKGSMLGLGDGFLERPIYFGIPAALILYGLISFERKKEIGFPIFLQKIGDASYSLYLSHVLVLSLLGRIWKAFGGDQYPINYILIVVFLGAAVFVGWLSFVIIERPMINYLQKRLFKPSEKALAKTHA
tara:strand:+ start:4467 stop:5606 length:1140 start_codon:yes stop_codon:yes gene_type:complete